MTYFSGNSCIINQWIDWLKCPNPSRPPDELLDISSLDHLINQCHTQYILGKVTLLKESDTVICAKMMHILRNSLPNVTYNINANQTDYHTFLSDSRIFQFYLKVNKLPLKNAGLIMDACAYRLALLGAKAFNGSHFDSLSCVFYQLNLVQKQYVLSKQPGLFDFRTNLPWQIGSRSFADLLNCHKANDLIVDAAYMGPEILFEAIKVLKDALIEICLHETSALTKAIDGYQKCDQASLSYQLLRHLLSLSSKYPVDINEDLDLIDSLNSYCSQDNAIKELYNLFYPFEPIKRAIRTLSWLKNPFIEKKEGINLSLTPVGKILCASFIRLTNQGLHAQEIIEEYNHLSFSQKKEFLRIFLLGNKISAFKELNVAAFLDSLSLVNPDSMPSIFNLCILATDLKITNEHGFVLLPRISGKGLVNDFRALSFEDKQWFLENVIFNNECLNFFFDSSNISLFFLLLDISKHQLGAKYFHNIRMEVEAKLLEKGSLDLARLAFTKMQVDLRKSVYKYIKRRILKSVLNSTSLNVLKKFFPLFDIYSLFSIAVLQDLHKNFLLLDPLFWGAIPINYQSDMSLVIQFLKPFTEDACALISPILRQFGLPQVLKHQLLLDDSFSSNFHIHHMETLLSYFSKKAISNEDMFFLATKIPYTVFLQVLPNCSIEVFGLHERIYFEDKSNTIEGHISELCNMEANGDMHGEYLRIFLNTIPMRVIGEGRFLQYLAVWIPIIFENEPHIIEKVFSHMPASFAIYIAQFIEEANQKWLLKPQFEVVFSKNISLLTPKVRQWLFANLQAWFPIRKDLIEHIKLLWKDPVNDFRNSIELLSQTKDLLILFSSKLHDFAKLVSQLEPAPDYLSICDVYQEFERIHTKMQPLLKNICQVSTTTIEDVVTGEILEGDIYCLRDDLLILSTTKDRLETNPFTGENLQDVEVKNRKVPQISEKAKLDLDLEKRIISSQIQEIRKMIIQS
jgi:hypothetical protein